jgi:cellulose synthase/poly-beta-1,6-N-acetylglucosamine synthase-like glycosyltransferase
MALTLDARSELPRVRAGRRASGRPVELSQHEAAQVTRAAVRGLAEAHPELSAEQTFATWQLRSLLGVAAAFLVGLVLAPLGTLQVFFGLVTALYFGAVLYRLACIWLGGRPHSMVRVPDEVALAADPQSLPRYTVLVPAYREPEVIRDLLAGVDRLEYPRDRLEVLLLLEQEDTETQAAVAEAGIGRHVKVVVVPPSQPRTKPKACNVGLALASGELVTIFDAEDSPDPLQLRRAAVAFRELPGDVVCLQARLGYHNAHQNVITRWFTAEYLMWFSFLLPGLAALGAPIPLGGTSNHMRVSTLRELGAWDPYNVTEDADLGVRLARRGYRTAVLDSLTLEEANSDFVNWAKQRSRWYKGYFQTWIVHMRSPGKVRRELGWRGLLGLNLFVGGTPLLALLNPFFWLLTLLFFVGRVHAIEAVFPAPVYFPAMFCWIFGNAAMVYVGILCLRLTGRQDLVASAAVVPVYWVMMAVAAIKAAVQLLQSPSLWEKTTHGLFAARQHRERADAPG